MRLPGAQVVLPGKLAASLKLRLRAALVHRTADGMLDEGADGFRLAQHPFELHPEL